MCACVGIICVRFIVMYMVGSAAFYWKEALIVAVKPYLNRCKDWATGKFIC